MSAKSAPHKLSLAVARGRARLGLLVVPAVMLAAAAGTALAMEAGAHPLHSLVTACTHLLASGMALPGGGPPNP
ncbi:MAG TPA: hypothetical protein VJQ45_11960 [Ktedonobacterales bacterium]|nr:hypothetical protein [Ktedonobacterales bacterium]